MKYIQYCVFNQLFICTRNETCSPNYEAVFKYTSSNNDYILSILDWEGVLFAISLECTYIFHQLLCELVYLLRYSKLDITIQ